MAGCKLHLWREKRGCGDGEVVRGCFVAAGRVKYVRRGERPKHWDVQFVCSERMNRISIIC